MGTPRTSTRKLKGKRPRSNLGQPQVKVSLLLIIPVRALSTVTMRTIAMRNHVDHG